ncbi:terephthalate dihydrodiol dehydrogenase [Roseomonas nepalensis]|uniref:Terephthalate dihydrodiol dehydrogenase n=1 Tax=Muricoccus nepalensis TaxID=1854500 RepID=A0A502F451_9PROT|nr:4-hydroxythreonine-4-phosphate dehydrogenase PdxA [Roseomonas nepalensis]TPG44918.1 terephthalate dihydrodiol dehydrogenase [Roseomonas nepalensis]
MNAVGRPPKLEGAPLPRIALALGDPAGIGPEIALKAALDPRVRAACRPLLVGDRRALDYHARACGIDVPVLTVRSACEVPEGEGVVLLDLDGFGEQPLAPGEVRAAHGRAAVEAAAVAVRAALEGAVEAVAACPQTEFAIKAAGIAFDGYPTFVARCTDTPEEDAFLMLCFDDKRIVHTTLHVGLRQAIDLITEERVLRVLEATRAVLVKLGVATPQIAVSGLNPHASEHGMFGNEEATIIEPAMERARARGILCEGPFGADTMFQKAGYDAFVVMVHDQGHLAAKLLATNRTAGMTIGTPVLFSSVAHGSALEIAGMNKASPEAVVEALLRLAGAATRARAEAAA